MRRGDIYGVHAARRTFLYMTKKKKIKKEEDYSDLIPFDNDNETQHSTITPRKGKPPFLVDKKSHVISCGENIRIAVAWLFPTNFRTNEWTKRTESNLLTGKWHNLTDSEHMHVRSELAKQFTNYRPIASASLTAVVDAVHQHAHDNKIDEAIEYFGDLYGEWDNTPRLDTWLCNTYGVEDNTYYRAVGSNFLKGMIKRIFIPGCKFDTVMVLEGGQGIGKSSSLELLGGDWHTTLTAAPDNKDFFMTMQGKMIVEFSEGETLSRAEVKQLKSVISTRIDTFRPPYGHETRDFPRRCVFAMSTNQSEYLKDETGNRRWLPVACQGKVNLEWLRDNKRQLFAEAQHRVMTLEENIYEFPEEETRAMQDARLIEDPEQEKIIDWYFTLTPLQRADGISTQEAFNGIQPQIGYMKLEKMTRYDQIKLGSILQNSLYLERRRTMKGNMRIYRYYPTDKTSTLIPELSTADQEYLKF